MNFRILNEIGPWKSTGESIFATAENKDWEEIDQGKMSKPSNQKMRDVNKVWHEQW